MDGGNLILPDKAIAAEFWQQFSPDDPVIRLRFVRKGHKAYEREGTVDEVWPDVLTFQGQGYECYYFPNRIRPGRGSGYDGMADDSDVRAVRALFVDQDAQELPGAFDPIVHADPSFRVLTSVAAEGHQKGQLIWLVRPIVAHDDGAGNDGTAALGSLFRDDQRRLSAHYNSDRALINLSRILRLPGSIHQKDPARPQLVTFQTVHVGQRESSAVLAGVAELPDEEPPHRPSPAEGRKPVAEIILRETLSYIDPPADEPEWRKLIAAIKATPLLDGDGEEVAVDWSAGQLDRGGKYVGSIPPNWGGDEVVRQKYAAAKEDKPGGRVAGFGTLVYEAQRGGMPQDDRIPREWRAYAAHQAASTDAAREGLPPGPFLLRPGDLFAWPDPKPLIADFLMQGEDACLYSPPKSGKTFVALDAGLSLAAGLPVLGHLNVLRPGEAVVYLSGEGHAGMKRRIMAWGAARGLTRAQIEALPFYYKTSVPPTKDGNAGAMRYIAGIKQFCTPVLIVIDTMSRSLGAEDENTAAAANAYLNMVGAIREAFGCTMLTLAHSGKGEGAAARGVRGSSAFTGGFDAIWFLEANKDNRTAKLEAAWLKDADEMGPHCFRMEQVHVPGMGMGAVLRYLPLASYKDPEQRGTEAMALRFRIGQALTENKITGHHHGWTHAVLAEKLMPTPRPPKDENVNSGLAWETAYQALRSEVYNASRSADGRRLGGKHVIQRGQGAVWLWYLSQG